jgi:protein-L-isoaspartate(D-aspartate) O-methyltransferase
VLGNRTRLTISHMLVFALLALMLFPACAQPGEKGVASTPGGAQQDEDIFAGERKEMVDVQIIQPGIHDARVIAAMSKVPRHLFVPDDYLNQAYEDHPLPIGYGQTISQPYIVALMTEHLALQPGEKVLEIGTGSGYQAAILAELTTQVYTVEIIEPLERQAATTLEALGYNVHCKIGDGYYGWPEHAPFDAIIVTCAPDHVPPPLLEQLKDGGRLVIPVGPPGFLQTLWLIEKNGDKLESTNLGGVSFVPLLGEY